MNRNPFSVLLFPAYCFTVFMVDLIFSTFFFVVVISTHYIFPFFFSFIHITIFSISLFSCYYFHVTHCIFFYFVYSYYYFHDGIHIFFFFFFYSNYHFHAGVYNFPVSMLVFWFVLKDFSRFFFYICIMKHILTLTSRKGQ